MEYDAVIHNGLEHVLVKSLGVIYMYYGLIESRNREWIQGDLNILISLITNVAKSKMMTCKLGTIWSGMLEEVMVWQITGKGATYSESLRRFLLFLYCGVKLTVGYMMDHHRRLHVTEPVIDWYWLPFS